MYRNRGPKVNFSKCQRGKVVNRIGSLRAGQAKIRPTVDSLFVCFWFLWGFFGLPRGMRKFQGQELNPHYNSDKAESLTSRLPGKPLCLFFIDCFFFFFFFRLSFIRRQLLFICLHIAYGCFWATVVEFGLQQQSW